MSGDYSYEGEAIHRWECEVAFDSFKDIAETISLRDKEIEELKRLVADLREKRRPASALKLSGLHMEIELLERLVKTHENTIEPLAKMVADERELRLAAKQEADTLRATLEHTKSSLRMYVAKCAAWEPNDDS